MFKRTILLKASAPKPPPGGGRGGGSVGMKCPDCPVAAAFGNECDNCQKPDPFVPKPGDSDWCPPPKCGPKPSPTITGWWVAPFCNPKTGAPGVGAGVGGSW